MWKEFKEFAFKGNVLDMSIGVIIGGAFGKIVTSLVNDIIMPFFGFVTAGTDFTSLKLVLSPAVLDAAGEVLKPEAATIPFLQEIFPTQESNPGLLHCRHSLWSESPGKLGK